VCGKAGRNALFLVKKTGTSRDVLLYLNKFKAKNIRQREEEEQEEFKVSLPEEYIPLVNCYDSLYAKRAIRYLNGRGISFEDILFFKVGIAFSGRYENRIILPSFNASGDVNFFTTRIIDDSRGGYKYLDAETPKAYKKDIIINELNVDWASPVVIVEGLFDAMKAKNAVPLLGSILRKDYMIFQKIAKSGLPVYLAGDADAIGKFEEIGKQFLEYSVDAYFIDVHPFKDVGEMNKNEFQKKYNAATLLTRRKIFKNKLQRLFL
jgi:DNA primase